MTDPRGNQTVYIWSELELTSVTHGAGTPSAATTSFTYDPATLGQTTVTDPNGHVTSNTFDSLGNLITSTDPLGHVRTTSYNALSEPLDTTDALGITTSHTYDANGNVLSVSTPLSGTSDSRTTNYVYGDGTHPGDVSSLMDPNGKAWQFSYDADGDLAASTDPVGDKTTYSYDAIGRRTSAVSPRGNVTGADAAAFTTSYVYSAFGDPTKVTDPLGHVTSYVYDADRNRTSVTDPENRTTTSIFDAGNELTKTVRADGTSLNYQYDSDGNQTAQTDGAGHTNVYSYDALNRKISSTDPLGRATTYTYDGDGNQLTLVDPAGRVSTSTYDADSERTGISYSDGTTPAVTYSYDADGQRTQMTDGTGTTSYTYDSLNRITGTTNGAGAVVDYTYDLVGRVTGLTYPNAQTVTRAYDDAGHLTGVTDWLGHTTNFSYDPDANLSGETVANGVNTTTTFNNADQSTSITDTKSATTLASFTYTRDNAGQLATSNSTGVSAPAESYGYTALDQLGSVNNSAYGYDAADNLTKLSSGTAQSFDAANELLTSTPPAQAHVPSLDQLVSAGQPHPPSCHEPDHEHGDEHHCFGIPGHQLPGSSFGFKATTRSISLKANELIVAFVTSDGPNPRLHLSGGGLHWTRVAQAGRRLRGDSQVWEAETTAAVRTSISASLESAGLVRSLTVASFEGAASHVGAVASGNGGSGKPTAPLTTSNSSSLVWAVGHNWTLRPMSGPVPNAGQHLVSTKRDLFDSSWVQRTDPIATKGTPVDVGDQAPTNAAWALAAVEIPGAASGTGGGTADSYTYDMQGNRVSSTPAGGTPTVLKYDQANRLIGYGTGATYRYDGNGLRQSKTVGTVSTAFAWDQSQGPPLLLADGSDYYVYGPAGSPIEKITGSTVQYMHQDQQGSTRLLTDSTGSVVGTYSYDAYGNTTSHTGSASTTLQYDGQYTDAESGFQYLNARYYDPSTTQFLSRDPLQLITQSAYGFAAENPLNNVDPLGLFGWSRLFHDTATIAAVGGLLVAGCALTGCVADVAGLATVGGILTGIGTVSDVASAAIDCTGHNSQCTSDLLYSALDVVTLGGGKAFTEVGRNIISLTTNAVTIGLGAVDRWWVGSSSITDSSSPTSRLC